jgi:hypothetical protein
MSVFALTIVGAAGQISAGILVLAAGVTFVTAIAIVLTRRSLIWTLGPAGLLAGSLLAFVRHGDGVSTLREDAIAIALLSAAGSLVGTAPVAYARWVGRMSFDAARRPGVRH